MAAKMRDQQHNNTRINLIKVGNYEDPRTRRCSSAPALEPRKCDYRYQPAQPLVYQVNPADTYEEVVMNNNNIHDHGVLVHVNFYSTNKKSTAMAY